MQVRDDVEPQRQIRASQRQPRRIRLRRPASLWGWLLWLLVALLFYLLISYVVAPWWYNPTPTDIPPAAPDSNARST